MKLAEKRSNGDFTDLQSFTLLICLMTDIVYKVATQLPHRAQLLLANSTNHPKHV